MRLVLAIAVVPSDGIQKTVTRSWCFATSGVFPFFFAGQSHSNRFAVSTRAFPIDLVGRTVQAPIPAGIGFGDSLVGLLGYLGFADPETPGDFDPMGTRLPTKAPRVSRRTPHRVHTGRNPDVTQAIARVDLAGWRRIGSE